MSVFILKDFGTIRAEADRLDKAALAANQNELLPIMERIAVNMVEATAALWKSEGRRGGGSWKKLKPETIKRKGHSQILVKTGTLKASLTEIGAPFQILNVTSTTVEFGTDDSIGEFHQRGAGNLPKRPILRFITYDEKRWQDWLLEHLIRAHHV